MHIWQIDIDANRSSLSRTNKIQNTCAEIHSMLAFDKCIMTASTTACLETSLYLPLRLAQVYVDVEKDVLERQLEDDASSEVELPVRATWDCPPPMTLRDHD